MQPGGGERPERTEGRRPILRAPAVAQHPAQAQEQPGEPGQRDRETDETRGGEQLQEVVVGVPPSSGEVGRLDQRERLAKRTEAGAGQRKTPDQVECGVPGVDPYGPADVARQADETAEALLPADQGDHREAGHCDDQPGREPAPAFFAGREQNALDDHRHQPREQPGARTGKRQPGKQQQPDDDRRRHAQQAALQLGFLAGAAERPPTPGEDHRQGEAEKERQMVGIDESSAQPFVGARDLVAPDFVGSGEPSPGAVEHLEHRRCDQGEEQRPPPPPIPPGDSCGDQGRGDGGERERRAERFSGSQRQRNRPFGGSAQQLARGLEQANVTGGKDGRERSGPGERLENSEPGEPQERAGRPLQAAEGAGRFAGGERQGEQRENGGFEQRLAPRGDAAEGQRRPKQENRERTGHQPFRLAYHRATVPRTPGRLHRRSKIRGRRSSCKIP